MKATIYSVNSHGLAEIKCFLAANHKKGGDYFNDEMLRAWAEDAEFQLREGNTPTVEIRASDCVHGRTADYTLSDAGLDCETVKIDE